MPFVPSPNIVQVEVRAILDGQRIENRFMINVHQQPTPAICNTVAVIVGNWVIAEYAPLLPVAVQLTEVYVKSLEEQNGPEHTFTYATPLFGGRVEEVLPNETSFCISLRTGNIGRSARGRVYVLAICKVSQLGNRIAVADANNFRDAFDALRATLTESEEPYDWSIVSYRANNAPRPGGPVYFPVTTVTYVDTILDSQRRRKPGNGS